MTLDQSEIVRWLVEDDPKRLERLWGDANEARRANVGDAVHCRGLLEISSHCDRSCLYCGLRMPNRDLVRYRMSATEILQSAREAVRRGYGTVVMQSGEDPGLDVDQLCQLISTIKSETPLAVTLSLGELSVSELQRLKQAGADRYLLRFETSNRKLFEYIHPAKECESDGQRWGLLGQLREMGYELGSGAMIGLPGQSIEDLARDVEMFRELDLDMIGVGPYVPHPGTPLDRSGDASQSMQPGQSIPDELTTYKMIALARLVCPSANIPSTTALATINPRDGQSLGLQRGANVIMPNLTPLKYRQGYEIYPDKAGALRTPDESDDVARGQLAALGRPMASGRGDSPSHLHR